MRRVNARRPEIGLVILQDRIALFERLFVIKFLLEKRKWVIISKARSWFKKCINGLG